MTEDNRREKILSNRHQEMTNQLRGADISVGRGSPRAAKLVIAIIVAIVVVGVVWWLLG